VKNFQGMDLKIIKSMKKIIKNRISIVDIEPGFFPFYKNGDTISEVFEYMSKYFEFADINFGLNFKVSNRNMSKIEKKVLFFMNNPTKLYSNVTFINKINDKRIILLKLIYLIKNNKLFEARELINKNHQKDKFFEILKKEINLEINYKKIKFLFLAPLLFLKTKFKI